MKIIVYKCKFFFSPQEQSRASRLNALISKSTGYVCFLFCAWLAVPLGIERQDTAGGAEPRPSQAHKKAREKPKHNAAPRVGGWGAAVGICLLARIDTVASRL